jgi:hypothetical protein
MSKTLTVAVCAAVLAAACKKPASTVAHRMEIRRAAGNTIQFIPEPDQLPYCLIYTQTEKGVTRQMTMPRSNQSVQCPAGEPVLGLYFRMPADEGRVHVQVLFSDQRLEATALAAQVVEMAAPGFNPMDLRLPGRVVLDTQEYVPVEEPAALVGEVVQAQPDGGSHTSLSPALAR